MSRKKLVAIAAAAVLLTSGVGATSAAAASAHRDGAYVWTSGANRTINVKDTANDSAYPAGDWRSNRGSGGRVTNQKGFNTTESRIVVSSPETLTEVRACRSNGWRPISCGTWNNGPGSN